MAHLITPIRIDGFPYCCDPVTRRTEALLGGMAAVVGENEWEIYRVQQGEGAVSGSLRFGVCCATTVDIELTGEIETLNTGYDNIEVLLNGEREFFHESLDTSDDPDETIHLGPILVTLTLTDRPCGHLIEIRGGTVDGIANNDVWWRATVAVR
ncbi:MAG: hypothetical protein KA004_04660 [Verrucomicrobiales bacterium]|nr:hypothetical protein [Verrucomicrobiales bacterium]